MFAYDLFTYCFGDDDHLDLSGIDILAGENGEFKSLMNGPLSIREIIGVARACLKEDELMAPVGSSYAKAIDAIYSDMRDEKMLAVVEQEHRERYIEWSLENAESYQLTDF